MLPGGIRRAQFPTQLYLFASWGVGASGGHQTDIFITSRHKYTNTNTNTYTNTSTNIDTNIVLSLLQVGIKQINL